MSAALSPTPKMQFFDANGAPLAGGKLYTYAAGTSTPLATYTDATGQTANANPVIADSRGEMSVWLDGSLYKFILKSATDTTIWTVDNISANASAQSTAVTATQGQTAVTVPIYVAGGSLLVTRNGLVQNYNVDYTETNSTTITFVAPGLSLGDVIITRF
tara:strand:- start:148 stop:627 length:480 start_codon:yes stop_codon:yes gene_type:complete